MSNEPGLTSLGDDCWLDVQRQLLIKDKKNIHLSTIQSRLLFYLAENREKVVSSKDLIRYAYGENAYVSRDKLYIQINRLRKHLENDPRNPVFLISLRGLGYMLFPYSNRS